MFARVRIFLRNVRHTAKASFRFCFFFIYIREFTLTALRKRVQVTSTLSGQGFYCDEFFRFHPGNV